MLGAPVAIKLAKQKPIGSQDKDWKFNLRKHPDPTFGDHSRLFCLYEKKSKYENLALPAAAFPKTCKDGFMPSLCNSCEAFQ